MAESTRRVTRYILIAIALIAVAVILWKISVVIVIGFGGVVGAALFRGIAIPLGKRTGLAERWSLSIVLVLFLCLLGLLAWLFGHQAASQLVAMRELMPTSLQKIIANLERSTLGHMVVDRVKDALGGSKFVDNLNLVAGTAITGVADLLLIFFLAIYLAFDPLEYLNGFLRLLPPAQRPKVETALVDAGRALKQWLLAQLAGMVVIGLLVGAGLSILGVPLAFILGLFAGLLEFVPVVGAILFTIPGVLVAFTVSPEKAFYVLLFYVGIQQLESNVIIPLLQRWAVRLPAAITLVSVVIGGILLGGPGIVFATPLAVVVLTLVKHLYVEDTLEHVRAKPVAAPRIGARGR
ncbi:MAG: hypothetical protein JWM35_1435 [Verrucomicrobia bacterium]|nr:hypothetical protein [Verrucomicrobiota bacterium]